MHKQWGNLTTHTHIYIETHMHICVCVNVWSPLNARVWINVCCVFVFLAIQKEVLQLSADILAHLAAHTHTHMQATTNSYTHTELKINEAIKIYMYVCAHIEPHSSVSRTSLSAIQGNLKFVWAKLNWMKLNWVIFMGPLNGVSWAGMQCKIPFHMIAFGLFKYSIFRLVSCQGFLNIFIFFLPTASLTHMHNNLSMRIVCNLNRQWVLNNKKNIYLTCWACENKSSFTISIEWHNSKDIFGIHLNIEGLSLIKKFEN